MERIFFLMMTMMTMMTMMGWVSKIVYIYDVGGMLNVYKDDGR